MGLSEPSFALMRPRDLADDGKAKTGAVRAGADERLEQAIPDAGVHARAAVGDTKQQASTVDLRRDDDLAACGRVLDRVQDQIVEGALQL